MEQKVRNLIEQTIINHNYRLEEVKYEKENNHNFLRIVIDKVGIIDLEDCVYVTNLIDPILDKCDFLNDSYILDVSSKEKGGN